LHLLVTGGTGYIGSHTCIELLQAGHEVTIIDNLINSQKAVVERIKTITGKSCVFYQTDVLDTKQLETVFRQHSIDAVIHFAALKSVAESTQKPLLYYKNNVTGLMSLLTAMKSSEVKTLIFSSSATVYGTPDFVPIQETAPLKPATNPYGSCKQMAERILTDELIADPNWNISILRYFNPAGSHSSGLLGENPKDIPNNLLPYIAKVAVGRLPYLTIYGNDYNTIDGTGVRDYIHVTDLALGHIAALETHQDNKGVHIYNLGTGKGSSVLQVLHAFEKACGRKIPFKYADRRPGDIATSYADPTLANKKLKWEAERSLDEMMLDAWLWQSKHPNGL